MHNEYARDVEDGNTAVLFIHGINGSPTHFHKFIELVPNNVAVHAILLPGHGGTVSDFAKSNMNEWRGYAMQCADRMCERYDNVIICAHSMGTFFATEYAIAHPDRIKQLFFLTVPLVMHWTPTAIKNAIRITFDRVPENDVAAQASRKAYSCEPCRNIFAFIPWIPRYGELISEGKRIRKIIDSLSVPCLAFQSDNDELVSKKSEKYLRAAKSIKVFILKNSTHNYYAEAANDLLLKSFVEVLDNAMNNCDNSANIIDYSHKTP